MKNLTVLNTINTLLMGHKPEFLFDALFKTDGKGLNRDVGLEPGTQVNSPLPLLVIHNRG